MKIMGRIGGKAILYFEIVTTLALVVGLGAANLVQPGAGIALTPGAASRSRSPGPALQHMSSTRFPPASSMPWRAATCSKSSCSRFFSEPPAPPSARKAAPVLDFCQSLSDVMFRYTDYVMLVAPLGVFGAIAATVGDKGLDVLAGSRQTCAARCRRPQIFFVVVVLGAVHRDRPDSRCAALSAAVREPFLIAFSTASSEAALPLALENMERFGVPQHIAAFVLPDRIQLQSGRRDSVSVADFDLCRAGRQFIFRWARKSR